MLRSIALTLFVIAALPRVFREPFVGLLLWLLFSYMNPHRLVYGFARNFHWVMIIAGVTLVCSLLNPESRQPIKWNGLSVLLALFLVWTGITTTTAAMGTLATARWIEFLKIQAMVFTTLMLVKDRERLNWLIWTIVVSFGFWGAKGGFFTLVTGGHYHVMGPVKSFFRDNNQFALVMCMTLPLVRYLQIQSQSPRVKKCLWAVMGLTVMSIVGTYSRGGLLGLLAVLLMLFIKSRSRMGLLLVILISIPLVFNFLPQKWTKRMDSISHYKTNESAQGRLQSWEFATNVALARPLTAGGFSVWASDEMWDKYGPPDAVHRAIHSIFFQVLGEQGIIGLSIFLLLLTLGWRQLRATRRLLGNRHDMLWLSDLAGYLQVSVVGYVVAGAFLPQAYFDFTYQILAISILIHDLAEKTLVQEQMDHLKIDIRQPTVPMANW